MRIRRVGGLIAGVIVGSARCARRQRTTGCRTQSGLGLADLQPRSRRHPLLAADADQHDERLDARAGVVVSTAARAGQFRPRDRQAGELVRNLSAGHAHRRERRDVSAVGQSRRRARAGDREGNLALRAARRTRLVPRRRVLARRRPACRPRIFFTSLQKADRAARRHRRARRRRSATAVTSISRFRTPECP